MNTQEAKARIGNVWNLGSLLQWPLSGQTLDFAFWRGNQHSPALSITPDGRGWFDHATGDKGDMVAMLAKVENLSVGDACRRLIQLARGVAEAPPPVTFAPRETPEEKRNKWPTFAPADWPQFMASREPRTSHYDYVEDYISAVIRSRKLPHFVGVRSAVDRGLLVFLKWFDNGEPWPVDAWGITDASRNAAQVRRMDGKPWRVRGRDAAFKSKSLPGSVGCWPIGIAEVGDRADIILTEGEPDLLAAITLHCLLSPDPATSLPRDPGTFGFCCLTGGAKRIAESALPLFKGKTVRIVPHIDPTGTSALDTWGLQLTEAGAKIMVFDLAGMTNDAGEPAKDLNDVVTFKGFPAHVDQLAPLFSP